MDSKKHILPQITECFSSFASVVVFLLAALPSAQGETAVKVPNFSVAKKNVIDFEDISRRKWGNPVIADLDRDGYLDLILTEHAKHAQVFWNDDGQFAEPVKLIGGDTHGVTVGDVDRDGFIELIVVPGGGGGKKPSSPFLFDVSSDRTIEKAKPLEGFKNSRGRAGKLIDIDNDGMLELITTAFEGTDRGGTTNFLYDNNGDGTFKFVSPLPRAARMGFRTLVTDFNSDGDSDLIFYGGPDMVVAQGGKGLTFTDATAMVLAEVSETSLASGVVEIDFDNDGDFDLFVTRARHPFGQVFNYDTMTKRFYFFTRIQEMMPVDLEVEGDFEFENLQMAYPHFDVFVGAEKRVLKFEGQDRHGGKNFKLTASEAEGWPEDRASKGIYLGHVGKGVWRLAGHTQSPTSMVVHNVVSQHESTKLKELSAKLLENRNGVFVDVTAEKRLAISEQTTGAAVGDFNNDGWSDIFIVHHGESVTETRQTLLLNEGGRRFYRAYDHGIVSQELGSTGNSADAFDHDRDGDLDILFSNERGQWHLFTNELQASSDTNYLVVNVGSSPSGEATALGAILTVQVGDNIYQRVVGATGASFEQGLNTYLHVGLGAAEKIDKSSVRWSNGEEVKLEIESVNRIIEAGSHEVPPAGAESNEVLEGE